MSITRNDVQQKLDSLLMTVERPASYIGGEPNSVLKEDGSFDVRFAMCFPDTYEIGMSWNGLSILYNILNKTDFCYMERVFAPKTDMQSAMKKCGLPLFTLETKTPVKNADIVGFTLQYEMAYTNILCMMDLAGIPLYSADRSEDDPLIIAGGPCAFNAEPLADFFDAVLIGDGEELLPEFCRIYGECRRTGLTKRETLLKLQELQGVYVPSFYKPVYGEDGSFVRMEKTEPSAPDRVLRAFLSDLNKVDYPECPINPLTEVVQERAVCELFRGCTRGCRFCQAGMIYRPVRERSKEKNFEYAVRQLENSGYDELSLLSLSTSDYSGFEPLMLDLIDYCKSRKISVSLPSLRLDNFSFRILDEIQGMRKTGLTFAPEAGTQRLRDVINKNITEEDILGAIDKAIDLGWNSVKLYFMIGLPTETDEDVEGIADIAEKIMDLARSKNNGMRGRFSVSVSVANFVPKPFTPFQWVPQNSPEEFARKHDLLRNRIRRIKGVTLHYHESFVSTLEAVLARGGRELCGVIKRAWELGCRFDSWTEHFNEDAWRTALKECGIGEDHYSLTGIPTDAPLPWDIIDSGVSGEFLLREYNKAAEGRTTPDCRVSCNGCGINKHTDCACEGMLK